MPRRKWLWNCWCWGPPGGEQSQGTWTEERCRAGEDDWASFCLLKNPAANARLLFKAPPGVLSFNPKHAQDYLLNIKHGERGILSFLSSPWLLPREVKWPCSISALLELITFLQSDFPGVMPLPKHIRHRFFKASSPVRV